MRNGFLRYVSVCTNEHGRNGLAWDAQREAVRVYVNGGNWRVVAKYATRESERDAEWQALDVALADVRPYECTLLVTLPSASPSSSNILQAAWMCRSPICHRPKDPPDISCPTTWSPQSS